VAVALRTVSEARWRAASPVMRGRDGRVRCRESRHECFDPQKGQIEKLCRRCNENAAMNNGLAQRTIRRAVIERRLVLRRRACIGDLGGAVEAPQRVMDMGLRDIGLQRESKDRYEDDKAARRTNAPHSSIVRSSRRHQTRNRQNCSGLWRNNCESANQRGSARGRPRLRTALTQIPSIGEGENRNLPSRPVGSAFRDDALASKCAAKRSPL
jgi:hypothetical protein